MMAVSHEQDSTLQWAAELTCCAYSYPLHYPCTREHAKLGSKAPTNVKNVWQTDLSALPNVYT